MAEVTPFPGSLSALLETEFTRLLQELAGKSLRERARMLNTATDYLLRMQALGTRADHTLADTIEAQFVALLTEIQSAKDDAEGTCGLTVAERINVANSALAFLSKRRKLKRHDLKSGIDLLQSQFRDARRAGRRRGAS
jgi:hypothetical protein